MRLFVALPLAPEVQRLLWAHASGVVAKRAGARLTALGNLHLTVKFLGAVSENRLDALRAALRTATREVKRFTLVLDRTGAFPATGRPKVYWAAPSQLPDELLLLARAVERECCAVGFAAEERPFAPHVTLARLKDAAALTRRDLTGHDLSVMASVTEVTLFRSYTEPSGARYQAVYSAPLI